MAKNTAGEVSGWTGWIGFAAAMLLLSGVFHVFEGLTALFNDKMYVVGPSALWIFDITQWGWVHILGGILVILAAASLIKGGGYGRTIAVIVALISASLNMAFVPVYPVWSVLVIAVDVLVIYAVIVHGGELKIRD